MTIPSLNLDQISMKLHGRRCYTMADALMGRKDSKGEDLGAGLKALPQSQFLKVIMRDPVFKENFGKKGYSIGQEDTAAINELVTQIIEAPVPLAIGRDLVRIIETTKETIKVRKPSTGKARKTSRGKKTTSKGTRNTYIPITVDDEYEASDSWDLNYLEDSEWNVLSEETTEVKRATDQIETEDIIADLVAIADGDLATGAEVSAGTSNLFVWADFCNLWGAVASEDVVPNKVAMNPLQMADIFKTDQFVNSLMLGDFVDLSVGRFGRTILGTDVLSSSLVTSSDVFMLNADSAIMLALRRDSLINTWEDGKEKEFGVQCSSRYGRAYGRKETVARMDNA